MGPASTPDDRPGPALPETAMSTGSDEGRPGERLAAPDLTDDDRRVLAVLSRHDEAVVPAVEDRPEAGAAASDDATLAGLAGPGRERDVDPLDPVFREPGD